MVEALGERDVRPMVGDADEFDAVAPDGRGRLRELGLEKGDRLVAAVKL